MRFAVLLLVACSGSTSPPSNKGSGSAPATGLLPPIETACTSDADCGHAYTYELDGRCCDGTCSPRPANLAYLEKVIAVCKRVGHAERGCPQKDCVQAPALACVAGRCREK